MADREPCTLGVVPRHCMTRSRSRIDIAVSADMLQGPAPADRARASRWFVHVSQSVNGIRFVRYLDHAQRTRRLEARRLATM